MVLHGGTGTFQQVQPWVEALVGSHTVIAPDVRGHGRSHSPERATHNLHQYADDVVASLDELGIDRAALVGGSLGSAIVVGTAVRHPDRVSALVVIAPAVAVGHGRTPELQETLDRFARFSARIDDVGLDRFIDEQVQANPAFDAAQWRRHDGPSIAAWMRDIPASLSPLPTVDELRTISAPTLVIPAVDRVHAAEIAEFYASVIPRARRASVGDDASFGELGQDGAAGPKGVEAVMAAVGRLTVDFLKEARG